MMLDVSRRRVLQAGALATLGSLSAGRAAVGEAVRTEPDNAGTDRATWLAYLSRVASPVLRAVAQGRLRATMPVEAVAGHEEDRKLCSPLEAFARTLAGVAPWLELQDTASESVAETKARRTLRGWAQQGLMQAVDPGAADYMRFAESGQTLVDAAILCLALFRAPKMLLESMTGQTRKQLVEALQRCRSIQPPVMNWLLFSALNEMMLRRLGAEWDRMRVDYALQEHQSWYLGDGVYGDGPVFHADYYNSYIIHPFLLQLADQVQEHDSWYSMVPAIRDRARRYAAIQERMIGTNGEFPVLGRSMTYRGGAFHLLADAALRGILPEGVAAGAVRGGLTAVQRATLDPAQTFDAAGWLRIGLAGHQPGLGETYISTGSLYLCSLLWLPLGLPAAHPFWAAPAADWTQRSIWKGNDAKADHATGR